MRSRSIARLLFGVAGVATVTAQTPQLPSCAENCVSNIFSGTASGCSQLDVACICKSSSVRNTLSCCLSSKCDSSDEAQAINYAVNICGADGVTFSVPACSSSTSSSARSVATASHSTTSSSAQKTNSQAAATSSSASQKSGNNNAMTIGLGVGLGVGIPLVLCAAGYLLFLVWRTKRQDRQNTSQGSSGGEAAEPKKQFEGYNKAELPAGDPRHEVEGDNPPPRFEMQ